MMIIMFATTVGTLLALFLIENLKITQLGSLTQTQINLIFMALIWFLICVITWFGATRVEDNSFGLISPGFFIGWVFCNLGYIIGYLLFFLIRTSSITIQFDALTTSFLTALPLTIGPTLAASSGLKK